MYSLTLHGLLPYFCENMPTQHSLAQLALQLLEMLLLAQQIMVLVTVNLPVLLSALLHMTSKLTSLAAWVY